MEYEAARVKLIKPPATIAASQMARQMRSQGEDVIDLSLGEPDFDTPANIIAAGHDAMLTGQTRYTAADGTLELKDAIVGKLRRENGLDYEPSEICAANGAKQALFNTLMMLWTAPPPASEGATVRCLRNREEGAIHERRYHHRN